MAALARRGITDPEAVMVDPWSAGGFDGAGTRMARALTWIRTGPSDNGYARPVEGLIAFVDLNRMEVVRIEDLGVVPVPARAGAPPRLTATAPRDPARGRAAR